VCESREEKSDFQAFAWSNWESERVMNETGKTLGEVVGSESREQRALLWTCEV
jgi:hypothetical protein